jgi:predicted HAD superfamily Cof-like phosphohydrolase
MWKFHTVSGTPLKPVVCALSTHTVFFDHEIFSTSGIKDGEGRVSIDAVPTLDAVIDSIYVHLGLCQAAGWDAEGAFEAVHLSNMAKAGPDGYMRLDRRGKIIKPEGWTAPDLTPFVGEERKAA